VDLLKKKNQSHYNAKETSKKFAWFWKY